MTKIDQLLAYDLAQQELKKRENMAKTYTGEFIPTLGNMIEEIDKIIKGVPLCLRNNYAKLFNETEIQRLLFTTEDFEEWASEYCRDMGWKEPQ